MSTVTFLAENWEDGRHWWPLIWLVWLAFIVAVFALFLRRADAARGAATTGRVPRRSSARRYARGEINAEEPASASRRCPQPERRRGGIAPGAGRFDRMRHPAAIANPAGRRPGPTTSVRLRGRGPTHRDRLRHVAPRRCGALARRARDSCGRGRGRRERVRSARRGRRPGRAPAAIRGWVDRRRVAALRAARADAPGRPAPRADARLRPRRPREPLARAPAQVAARRLAGAGRR